MREKTVPEEDCSTLDRCPAMQAGRLHTDRHNIRQYGLEPSGPYADQTFERKPDQAQYSSDHLLHMDFANGEVTSGYE